MSALLHWFGLDVHWAYRDCLPGLQRQTGCRQRALDVLHDALLRFALMQQREHIREPQAYFHQISQHLLLDHWRRDSRYQWQAQTDDTSLPSVPDSCELAMLRQKLQHLQALIERLPPRCREVFWLVRVEGQRQQAVAEQLGISLNMVEKHLIRALLDLRTLAEA